MPRSTLRRTLLTVATFGIYRWLRKRRLRTLQRLRQHSARKARLAKTTASGRRDAIAAAIAAAGLAVAPPAHAISAGAIANAVTNRMKGMLSGLMGTFFQMLTQLYSQQTDKSVGAIGKTGDAIINNAASIENQRNVRETEPPPDSCRSDQLGAAGQEASINTSINTVVDDMTLARRYAGASPNTARRRRERRTAVRLRKYGPDSPNAYADVSASMFEKTQIDEKDDETTKFFIENVIGDVRHNAPALPKSQQGRKRAVIYTDLSASYHARRSLAQRPLLRAKNSRAPKKKGDKTQSERDVLFEEVSRTWGNPAWREEINNYAATTPLAKEMAKLLAFQNKLLFKQLEHLEEGNLILGTLLLESLDSPDWRRRLTGAYLAATGESKKIKKDA